MYVPTAFEEHNLDKLHEVMLQSSFATLVSRGGDGSLVATHLPLLLERRGAMGVLIGHMALANPQWKSANGQEVLTIFQGPHTYISPSWYQDHRVVPTWNYVAVHAHGKLTLENEKSRRLEIVRQYVDYYEAGQSQPWSLEAEDPEFIESLLDAIVGFRITIERLEGKQKLNQNLDARRRLRVAERLEQASDDNSRSIARLMRQSID